MKLDFELITEKEADEAQLGPRDLKAKDSKEYAIQTLVYIKRLWESRQASMERWKRALKEAEESEIWIALGLDSLDDLLKTEIGITKVQSIEELDKRDQKEEKNKHQGKRIDLENNFSSIGRKVKLGGNTQQYALRRLRNQKPDLHKKVLNDELSCHAAMVEAGFTDKTISIPINVEKIVRTIKKHFTNKEIEKIKELL